ncbi:DNA topology modulation protein [Alteribacter natronophilus]|uniref:DNA topology modulation protein n=1 Tax=Alteribacter natronophilus TaxID=2583810 RepID=UPI00110D275B|nr:DNA topology modulation protein [Alteribacter natronophilus]TMW71057.1 DNA topology modulation protein [Alteribacter natronophilus]
MKKIAVIGSGGSGKSTFARELGEKIDIDVHHLDTLFWKPGWVGVPKEQQREVQHELVQEDSWIIDGNYGSTMDIRLDAADTVIFLDLPRITCAWRVVKRSLLYRKRPRPDMADGCVERVSPHFLKWVWQYPEKRRPGILEKLESVKREKQVVILQSPKEVREFLGQAEKKGDFYIVEK